MNTPMICTSLQVRKGAWTEEEDFLLKKCIQNYGEGKWHLVPTRAGLNRCRKSCRLRWLNYLSPYIKRGDFDSDEIDLILRLHKLLGNRWSLIAGRLPGRTGNNVKNYWNTHIQRKLLNTIAPRQKERSTCKANAILIRPQPRRFTRTKKNVSLSNNKSIVNEELSIENDTQWWANILESCNEIEEATAAEIRIPSCKNIISEENCNETDKTPSLLNCGANGMQHAESGDGWNQFSPDDIWNLLN